MDQITNILDLYKNYQAEVNFLAAIVYMLVVAGTIIFYRHRGRKLREALAEWTELFTDLNKRVAELTVSLTDVREQLVTAKSEALSAKLENDRLKGDIERLEARVKELEEKEAELETQLKQKTQELLKLKSND